MTEIRTATEQDAFLTTIGETGEPGVIQVGRRPWIITEDDYGRYWAWSYPVEDEEGIPVRVDVDDLPVGLRLPWTLLSPDPSPVLHEEWGVEYEHDSTNSTTDYVTDEHTARAAVALSPTDRGLRRRYVTEWEQVR